MPQGKTLQECNEEWRLIEGFPDYKVSNTGRVMRLGYMKTTPLGHSFYQKERLMKTTGSLRRGYPSISLYNNVGHKVVCVHKIVAKAFVPNPKDKLEVNHKDGDKTNNKASNLEWCSGSENRQHAIDTGLIKTGSSHKLSLLTPEQVNDIKLNCVTSKRGYSQMDFARKYGVSRGCIKDILYGKTYKNEHTVCL